MVGKEEAGRLFDAYYYAHNCGAPYQRSDAFLQFFENVAERIVRDIQPESVLDAGCAMGFLVESLARRGVAAWGVDLSPYAIEKVHPDVRDRCWVGSVTDPFPQRYNLIVSIEVVEHMPPQEAEAAVANLCRHSDDVLFSSTPFDYKEVTHFNVQPPEYWAELFAREGFLRDVDFDASFITPWAARFRRSGETLPRVVRQFERKFWLLWKENQDLRKLTLEMREQLVAGMQETGELEQGRPGLEGEGSSLRRQIDEIESSATWKLARLLGKARLRMAPPGSIRERFVLWVKRSLGLS